MVSFQHKLEAGLVQRGIGVTYSLDDRPYDAVLVTGGTRNLNGLWRARRSGVHILQRLDGMNWLHRAPRRPGLPGPTLRHFLRAEYGNLLLALIRSHLAHGIIYQSDFSRQWWEHRYGVSPLPFAVIHNGVDLNIYSPQGPGSPPADLSRLLVVEGSLMGGYELGLEIAVAWAQRVAAQPGPSACVELMIVGRVAPLQQEHWSRQATVPLQWVGQVPRERIPELDRAAHVLFSSDIHPACPNSVIEALACGLPVVSFDTGALPELVSNDAGRIVPYGSDPWNLRPPDVDTLAQATVEVLHQQAYFRQGARRLAEQSYGLDQMVDQYLEFLAHDHA